MDPKDATPPAADLGEPAVLDLSAIEKADDLPIRTVDVPEWGGVVCVRGLTARERDEFERENMNLKNHFEADAPAAAVMHNLRARLVAKCLCRGPKDRTPLFSNFLKGTKVIGEKSGAVIDRIFDVCSALSGMSEADVEATAGNFEDARSASPGSGGASSTGEPSESSSES